MSLIRAHLSPAITHEPIFVLSTAVNTPADDGDDVVDSAPSLGEDTALVRVELAGRINAARDGAAGVDFSLHLGVSRASAEL